MLTNKVNELTKFIIKNKIGVVIGKKTDMKKKLKELKKIKKKFLLNNYNQKVLSKYFNVDSARIEIIKNFEK